MMSFWKVLLLLSAACLVPACSDNDNDDVTSGTANLRTVNVSPDSPNQDVRVDNVGFATNLAYGGQSAYQPIGSGTRNIGVRSTGTNVDTLNQNVGFSADTDSTLLIANTQSNLETIVLTDDNSAPAAGQVRLRLVHAAPSGPPVDVYVTDPGANIGVIAPTISNLTFRNASTYVSVPAGNVRIQVTPTGTKAVAVDSGTLALSAGAVRTIVVRDAAGGGAPFGAVVLTDQN